MTDTDKKQGWLAKVPNQLTIARIAVAPVLLFLYPLDFFALKMICALLFMLAALTDFFDGYLARRYNNETSLGALLDPVADKLLVAACLILLADAQVVWAWLAGLLICREIWVSGLRLVALEKKMAIKVSDYGKWKTFVLDVAIFCLLVNEDLFGWPFKFVGWTTLWISLALSLYSAYLYSRGFWSDAKDSLV